MRIYLSRFVDDYIIITRLDAQFHHHLDAPSFPQAIKFDGEGRREDSLRSFQAAVRFSPGSETWTNLGVCSMRLGTATSGDRAQKVLWYHKAFAAMEKAEELAVNDKELEHVRENKKALRQSMTAEQVDDPFDLSAIDPMEVHLEGGSPNLGSFSFGSGGEGERKKKRRKKKKKPEDGEAAGGSGGGGGPVKGAVRDRLLHHRPVPLGRPMPRVSVAQIDGNDPAFEPYRSRSVPFILTGALEGWGALEDWPLSWDTTLPDLWPNAVTDFYPYNMLSTDRQNPYLTRLPRATAEIGFETGPSQQADGSAWAYDRTAQEGRYMHLQLTPKMWTFLEERGDVSAARHWHLSSDDWLEECLGYPDRCELGRAAPPPRPPGPPHGVWARGARGGEKPQDSS